MPRTKRIRDLRRRSKSRLVYQKDGLLLGTTTQPTKDNKVTRVAKEGEIAMEDLTRDDLGLYVDISAETFDGLPQTPSYLVTETIQWVFTHPERIEINSVEVV